jgi:hypothetical protein
MTNNLVQLVWLSPDEIGQTENLHNLGNINSLNEGKLIKI